MEISYHNIKDLNVTLEQLYNEEKQINIHLSGKNHNFVLILVGRDKTPDFCVSSWTYNIYLRSLKGMNRQRYTSLNGIQKAVERLVKKLDSDCIISYSLSNEVHYF